MNQEISINPGMPNLYSYLIRCAIEQKGPHTFNGIEPDAKDGTDNDINLILKYVELELKSDLDEKSKKFLETISSNLENNLKVHHTRDCQIIETGSHYVNLIFSSRKDNFIYNIKFSSKFKQNFGKLPIGTDKINISYYCDNIFNKKIHKKEDYLNYTHTVNIDENTIYYRDDIKSKEVDINDDVITFLPTDYLAFNEKDLVPKLNPDACVIV